MGTEVAISFTALRAQLESERSSLYKIDENIKKIVQTTGRFSNDRFNNSSSDYLKGGPRLGGRNSFPDSRQNDDSFGKRKQETKTVFSRLSARTPGSDDEESGGKRPRVISQVSRELPTRAAVLRAQGGDEQARTRNRRIFGSLLGTLQKFKQEEIVLQTKEEKKAQVERKIEEQARVQKEKEQKERKTLFAEREHKKATIKALEAKMARVQEFEKWEASQKNLGNFILTRAKPHIYWIPKKMTDKATEKLNSSRKYHEKCMVKKRAELQEELQRIEQRCLRARGPQAKENEPARDGDGAKKRDKFANDADHKDGDDSDGDGEEQQDHEPHTQPEGNGHAEIKEEPVKEETKLDTTTEQNSTMEAEKPREDSHMSVDSSWIQSAEPPPEPARVQAACEL
ncbi:pinin isoform X2 [Leguminivora glycinivorella]|uniref:pinin isoform X2 n=1 Tax=Leguminivora glycinivorella TaxID=1035111 RepID=UPI00200C4788|nr:pinin isoform X2 [Leguminivora glycinivorella]